MNIAAVSSERGLCSLPLEIQELILHYLSYEILATVVVKVCKVWNQIAMRTLRRRCLRDIPQNVICEILQKRFTADADSITYRGWDYLYLCWNRSNPPNTSPTNKSEINIEEDFTSYILSGECLITASINGIVNLYDSDSNLLTQLVNVATQVWEVAGLDVAKKGPYPVHNLNGKGPVLEHDYLLVVGRHFMHLYRMPMHGQLAEQVWGLGDLTTMYIAKASVFGSTFSVAEKPCILGLRRVELGEDNTQTTVKEVHKITCPSWLWKWKLWHDRVICILATGDIWVWGLDAEAWISQSRQCAELQYQNPCFIYRGIIFCSSDTSHRMLGYWHCNTGTSYWLICCDSRTFSKYYPKLLMGDDVTAVCMKRKMVAIGTLSGKVYLYDHSGRDSDIGSIWKVQPAIAFQMHSRPILSCDISFDGTSGLVIVARVGKKTIAIVHWQSATA